MTEILAQLQAFVDLGRDWFWAAALVFLRVGAAMFLMPAFGEQSVPRRIRLALTLAFTAIVMPAAAEHIPSKDVGIAACLIEMVVGLAIGIGLRLFILALQMAAVIIAQVTSLSQMFGGATPDPQPAIGNLLTMASLAFAVLGGLHVKAATLFILSYSVIPAGRLPKVADMSDWGLTQIVDASTLAFALAAPFVIASVIYNIALGIINKAMPQLSVTMVGAPVLTAGALLLMLITTPLVLVVWMGQFDAFLSAPFQVP